MRQNSNIFLEEWRFPRFDFIEEIRKDTKTSEKIVIKRQIYFPSNSRRSIVKTNAGIGLAKLNIKNGLDHINSVIYDQKRLPSMEDLKKNFIFRDFAICDIDYGFGIKRMS